MFDFVKLREQVREGDLVGLHLQGQGRVNVYCVDVERLEFSVYERPSNRQDVISISAGKYLGAPITSYSLLNSTQNGFVPYRLPDDLQETGMHGLSSYDREGLEEESRRERRRAREEKDALDRILFDDPDPNDNW